MIIRPFKGGDHDGELPDSLMVWVIESDMVECIIGINEPWDNVCYLWAIVNKETSNLKSLIKAGKRVMSYLEKDYHRITAYSMNDKDKKFMECIGMKVESVMIKGGPNKNNVNLHARVL